MNFLGFLQIAQAGLAKQDGRGLVEPGYFDTFEVVFPELFAAGGAWRSARSSTERVVGDTVLAGLPVGVVVAVEDVLPAALAVGAAIFAEVSLRVLGPDKILFVIALPAFAARFPKAIQPFVERDVGTSRVIGAKEVVDQVLEGEEERFAR